MGRSIAFIDFDGTLTKKDSFTLFVIYALSWPALIIKGVLFLPFAMLFLMRLLPNSVAKQLAVKFFFRGRNANELEKMGEDFARKRISILLRPGVLERIRWHQQQEHKTVIVSASLRYWLQSWCKENSLELICTELEENEGTVTGRLVPRNCFGPEKVRKIQERFDLKSYDTIYAYGDTRGDREMLAMAHQSYFKPFRGRFEFESQ